MFTGIIAACQKIQKIVDENAMRHMTIALPSDWQLHIGESVNVDGVCSTVVAIGAADFTVTYMPETLRLTTLSTKQDYDNVNLERSLRLNDLVSGHLVSGHSDSLATVASMHQDGDSMVLTFEYPKEFAKYVVPKGSVAINGVSLTVINPTDRQFSVAIIPHTWEHTNLSALREVDTVNVEYDLIAKYLFRQHPYVTTRA